MRPTLVVKLETRLPRRQWMASLWGIACASGGNAKANEVSVAPFKPGDVSEYGRLPDRIQNLIRVASELTQRKLGYAYGSNDPARGGMDCSGTIHHTLSRAGVKAVPRSSFDQFVWAREAKTLREIGGRVSAVGDQEFQDLRPGDLVFWEGTYETGGRKPAISHVMLYLGTWARDGQPVLFGASDGRRFRGKKIFGVSVFDFAIPKAGSKSRIAGYASVPGLR